DVTSAIVSSCANFFSVMLPSSSLLILDFIQAANGVVTSQNMELPREEAVTVIGSLLCFPNNVANMPLHQPGHQTNEYQPKSTCKDVKDKLISSLLRASKLDPSCSARCIALNALGVFIAEELIHCQGHPKVHECLCVLLASITFHNRSVCQVACGVIHLLSEYYRELVAFEKDLPLKIVEVLCHAIVNLLPGGESAQIQEQHKVLASVLMCLLDWLMVIPVSKLMSKTNEDENVTLLARIFQVLKMAAANKGPKKRTKQLNISTIISGDGRPIRLGRLQEESRSSSAGPSSPVDSLADTGGDVQEDDPSGQDMFDFPPKSDSVELTARAVLMHMVNHMGHYPLGAGPSRVDSLISEHEDNQNVDTDELSASIFNAPNVQFFVLNDSVLISLVELPLEDSVAQEVPASTAATQVRVITRDMTGKNVWDHTLLHGSFQGENEDRQASVKIPDLTDGIPIQEDGSRERFDISCHPLSKFKKCSTPVAEDRLDDLLCGIGVSSRECLLYPDHALNEPGPCPENVCSDMEYDVIDSVLEQDASVKERVENDVDDPSLSSQAPSPPPYGIPVSPFQLCRFVVSQTGMMTSEKRAKIDLLKKTDRFLRELKNLDNRRCRETHKIALVYVAQGQEDKTSIMSNSVGSQQFEHFVAGLAWEVDLSKHTGFLGGLEKNLSTGTTAPYYCNSTTEVMFHVSTRMPLATDNTGFNRKVRRQFYYQCA
ncbi:ral GTPase-activating protein subunit alpha-2-like, partial [Stylophora pistillata]|uniref:ral GTPase-activating protein subunit alpha-2-like n=1 Tax=Stylophora pistillata TaxID=50429 RepID=UPI000C047279